MNDFLNAFNEKTGPIISALAALLIVSGCFFILIKVYWLWYKKNILRPKGLDIRTKKPTLFDVRELLIRGQRETALKVYQEIFKVEQKEACSAVDALEKNIHKQG